MMRTLIEWKDEKTFGGELDLKKKTDFQDVLRLAVCSELRMNIILSLNEEKKALGKLREDVKISSTTAIHALRELEKGELVFQDSDRNYLLTSTGKIAALNLIDFSNSAEVLKKHKRFWLEHDLSGIPEHMMKKIGWLKDSDVVLLDPLDIIKAHSTYVSFIKNVNWIKGISPIFSPDYPVVFKELIENGVNTQLVLTGAVLNKLVEAMGIENLKNLVEKHSLEILLTDKNVKVALTASDTFISLGLFTNSGVYDTAHDLIGTNDQAIRWGVELFKYYRKGARKYEI